MDPDTLSVVLRSASFIALFQAAGMVFFLDMFGRPLEPSLSSLQRIIKVSAIAAMALLAAQYAVEAARMAGEMSGLIDPSFQKMAMHSAGSIVLAVRVSGLLLIAVSIDRRRTIGNSFGIVGAGIVAGSFMLIGHTAASPLRWVMAPLLTIHVTIVAFWFGALVPLYVVCTRELPAVAGQVTAAFSKVALWLVPGILAAGSLMALALVRHLAGLRSDYGRSLGAKLAGFAALMVLAALNKWRLAPAIASGDARALRAFRRSLGAEYVLLSAVLSITAIMTTFYSPEP